MYPSIHSFNKHMCIKPLFFGHTLLDATNKAVDKQCPPAVVSGETKTDKK